jgi:hypothetical protein
MRDVQIDAILEDTRQINQLPTRVLGHGAAELD